MIVPSEALDKVAGMPRYTAAGVADEYRKGRYAVVMVNAEGGPSGGDWRVDEYKTVEDYGRKLRVAVPSKVLNIYLGSGEDCPDAFRMGVGFRLADDRPIYPVGIGYIKGIEHPSYFFDWFNKIELNEGEPRIEGFNRAVNDVLKNGDERFKALIGQIDENVKEECYDWGAIVCCTHDVVMMSYLAAHTKYARFKEGDWPGYLDGIVVFFDRITGECTGCGLLPKKFVME